MADTFEQRYPNIDRFVFEHGWIEMGYDDYNTSFIRAHDLGGTVWEGEHNYDSMEAALADLERGLAEWVEENFGE